jgi:phenylacetate-CoA ligase
MWGAEVFDHFGMSEGSFVAGECDTHDGLYVWSDLFFAEVVNEETGLPVADGEVGSLVLTPLWNNTVTPFLRWNSGDLVSVRPQGSSDGPWSVFPVMRHARRTVGFFKVGGININHSELEDLMFVDAEITDFKAEVFNAEGGLDVLHLLVEARRGVDARTLAARLQAKIATTFELRPQISFLEPGTLGREFEASVKAARFVDRRG